MTAAESKGAQRLILLRHGRTEWNATGRFQGQADIALDELGLEQAQQAGEVLRHEPISQVWSSDLSRAFATASVVAELLGLKVHTTAELREINVGSWEGLTGAEVEQISPGYREAYDRGDDARRSETGETHAEVAHRVAAELTRIAASAADGSTVLVGIHGLAAQAGTSTLIGLPPGIGRALGGLGNCHWADLQRTPAAQVAAGRPAWRLEGWNIAAPGTVDGELRVRAAIDAVPRSVGPGERTP